MFFASIAGSVIAFFVVGILLTFIFIGSLATSISSGSGEAEQIIKKHSVLKMNLDAPIVERGIKDSGFSLSSITGDSAPLGLNNILSGIKRAQSDSKIEGIYMNLTGASGGFSAITDIRDELMKFKESGKWIIAYSEVMSQGSYYLASVADKVYLYPEGGMEWQGLSAELMFYKDMLERVGVDIQVLRGPDNQFKSAVEPYMRNEMSDANRLQYTELLGDLWNIMVTDVSESRGISAAKLNMIADSISLDSPEDAVNFNLVDGLKYYDEVDAILRSKLSIDDDEDINYVSLADYKGKNEDTNSTDDGIAVVYAVGEIQSGEGDDSVIGSERIAKALRKARLNENTKAIVFRVNSPGGSALASDVMWRECQLIKEAGIPLIVSMSDLAASGGYYISCLADTIVASEATITGSIGVFGMLPNAKGLLEDKMGIHTDRVSTNANSAISTFNPLTEKQQESIEGMISDIYYDFLDKVAEGRGMKAEDVDKIAQGRVWSGSDAKEKGLVDVLGNLEDAKAIAAERAGLSEYDVFEYPKLIDPIEQLLADLGMQTSAEKLAEKFGVDSRLVKELNFLLNQGEGLSIQARMPYSFIIK